MPSIDSAPISDEPWDGAASNYPSTDAYCAACLIDDNEGGMDKVQGKCHLPVFTPAGHLSRAGVHAAESRFGQVQSSGKAAGRAKLDRAVERVNGPINDRIRKAAKR